MISKTNKKGFGTMIDCVHLSDTGTNCTHADRKSIFHPVFRTQCLEYKYDGITCNYKANLWDLLSKKESENKVQADGAQYPPPGNKANKMPAGMKRPPAPPPPPPKRTKNF